MDLFDSLPPDAALTPMAPGVCLINHYVPGAKLSLHQDKDEQDLSAPSAGGWCMATWWCGAAPSRLAFHGVNALADGEHALLGRRRLNLTFRRVRQGHF